MRTLVVIMIALAAATVGANAGAKTSQLLLDIISELDAYGRERLHGLDGVSSPSEYPYFNVFPSYISSMFESGPVTWSSKCFDSNSAAMEISEDKSQILITIESVGAVVQSETHEKCDDFYLFACTSASSDVVVSRRGNTTHSTSVAIELPSDVTDAEWFDISTKGIRLSVFPNDPLVTFSNLLETVGLFSPEVTGKYDDKSDARVMEFMNSYTNFDHIEEADSNSFVLPESGEIHSGDFFGLLKLSGVGSMMGWATGSTTGHTFIAQWIGDDLYMCESTSPMVQCTEYYDFMANHKASSQIVWAPLKNEYRELYNDTASLEFYRSVEGMDYGFRTLLWGWMDDDNLNLPCLPPDFSSNCASWHYFETSLGEIDRNTNFGGMIWNPGIAKRLNVSDQLRTSELYKIAADRGIDMTDVLRIPEEDAWEYNSTRFGMPYVGKDMVCDVFVCNMWKAGGLFGNLVNDINCAEMVNWDVYALDFLEPEYKQIMGNHTLKLQFDYASKSIYPHMAETCSATAPDYVRDPDC